MLTSVWIDFRESCVETVRYQLFDLREQVLIEVNFLIGVGMVQVPLELLE